MYPHMQAGSSRWLGTPSYVPAYLLTPRCPPPAVRAAALTRAHVVRAKPRDCVQVSGPGAVGVLVIPQGARLIA